MSVLLCRSECQTGQLGERGDRVVAERLAHREAVGRHVEDGVVGVDAGDAADAGERVGARARRAWTRPSW